MTKQRERVLDVLRGSRVFHSAQQVHSAIPANTIGLATVYRALAALEEAGALSVMKSDDGETLYRYCETRKHHHHIVCRVCNSAQELDGAELERFLTAVGNDFGFSDLEHTIDVWGTCSGCR
jgi:Fur family ferric uptake transcriptional regulator